MIARTNLVSSQPLFLAWQDKDAARRQWFPIGRLDADVEHSNYRFRYTGGAERAHKEVGLPPMIDFPELRKDYRSSTLFALFKNRVIALGRPDRMEYLRGLDLSEDATSVEILSVSGGYRVTDSFEVFPKIEKRSDGSFQCRFFLQGCRYVNRIAQERTNDLKPGENLYVTLELNNPATGLAVQLQTLDYHIIGWVPRYLVGDLAQAMLESHGHCSAHVVQVNPLPSLSKQRILIELKGHWGKHEPMNGPDFDPLVG